MIKTFAHRLILGIACCLPLATLAQNTPHALMVVPAAGGGGADLLARLVASKMQRILGQSIVVENRPGANTAIGAASVTRAKPDGNTMLLTDRTAIVVNPLRMSQLPYDPDGLFPVSDVSRLDFLFVAGANAPFSSWEEMVSYARNNPGKVSVGSSGIGSGAHLSIELLGRHLGVEFVHVPYKGMLPGLNDMMGGVIDAMVAGPTVVAPQLETGKIRVLAQGSEERSAQFPNVPTLKELGIDEPLLIPVPFTLYVPTGTPPATIARLNEVIHQVATDPEVLERFRTMGMIAAANQPEDVIRDSEEFSKRLAVVIEETGLKE